MGKYGGVTFVKKVNRLLQQNSYEQWSLITRERADEKKSTGQNNECNFENDDEEWNKSL